ncbi:MAG: ROK family protein [Alphaproteobacteria bacterium]
MSPSTCPSRSDMAVCAGVDLGGSKIETAIFDANWIPIKTRRSATPQNSYADLVSAIAEQVGWIKAVAGSNDLPIGVGIPGLFDAATGTVVTANLAATGQPLRADLVAATSHDLVFEKDCNCFALSEAVLGAGVGFKTVFGLVLGTGVAGGFCLAGRLVDDLSGASGEVGHLGIPARLATEHELPMATCGCGRQGCYETLVSGPGMTRICRQITGQDATPEHIVAAAEAGDAAMAGVLTLWTKITADLIGAVHRTIDPECIVLGGGLSQIPDLPVRLTAQVKLALFEGTRCPAILSAKHADSGARGAALGALQQGQRQVDDPR